MTRSKLFLFLATAITVPTLAVGALHLPFARGFATHVGLGGAMGCPVRVSPEVAAENRMAALRAQRGTENAKTRPAFGFMFGAEKATLRAWGKEHGATCTEDLVSLRCEQVPGSALPGIASVATLEEVLFHFGPKGTLDAVAIQHHAKSPEEAEALYENVATILDAPQPDIGTPLDRPLASRSVERRFHDYAADVVAANLGARGLLVKAQAQAID